MAGGISRLTDIEVRGWLKDPTPKKLFDGAGLFLTMTPAGTAVWRLKYRHLGKERSYSIGPWPDVGLGAAREGRDLARALLRQGRDPSEARQENRDLAKQASANTLAHLTSQWLAKNRAGWRSVTYNTTSETLTRHVLKFIGDVPVTDLTTPKIAKVYERVAARSIDTAHRVARNVSRIFNLGIALGLCTTNPALAAAEVIPRRRDLGRRPALLTWADLGEVLRLAEAAHLSPPVRMAHRLVAFTAARMGTVVRAEWREFQLDGDPPLWVIPRGKMKMQDRQFDHKVVLGPVILSELREWRRVNGGEGYLFAAFAGDGEVISHESIEKAYRVTMGLKGKHTPHGWRAALSTLARDHGFDRDAVELALDHVHDNAVARAYDRGERLKKRVELAHWWNEKLTEAERG